MLPSLNKIGENFILELQKSQKDEDSYIEYKSEVHSTKSKENLKELGKDFSAFANNNGGIIFYGLEKNAAIVGLGNIDLDAEIRRLNQSLRNCVDPVVGNITFKPVKVSNKNILVAYIPVGQDRPHSVFVSGTNRRDFYIRTNNHVEIMTIEEIKKLCREESQADYIEKLYLERIDNIKRRNTIVPLKSGRLICLHLFPVIDRNDKTEYDIHIINNSLNLYPISTFSGYTPYINDKGVCVKLRSIRPALCV